MISRGFARRLTREEIHAGVVCHQTMGLPFHILLGDSMGGVVRATAGATGKRTNLRGKRTPRALRTLVACPDDFFYRVRATRLRLLDDVRSHDMVVRANTAEVCCYFPILLPYAGAKTMCATRTQPKACKFGSLGCSVVLRKYNARPSMRGVSQRCELNLVQCGHFVRKQEFMGGTA